ncbi:Uncharacterized protein APZ42_026619 [Daphnia magna]|uniref:Uncharacterized protein n=1 Tax=Daphnia magna TaxID=35525 RepID=A0A162DAQ9_9CRUS|nr:Uncharacterized protein APZ42_026619 [Daphnia magna]
MYIHNNVHFNPFLTRVDKYLEIEDMDVMECTARALRPGSWSRNDMPTNYTHTPLCILTASVHF